MIASPNFPGELLCLLFGAGVGAWIGFIAAVAFRTESAAADAEVGPATTHPERDVRPAPIKIFMPIHGLTLRPGELHHLAAVVRHEAETARYMADLMVGATAGRALTPLDRADGRRRAEHLERAAAVLGLVAATRETDAPAARGRATTDREASYDC